MSEVNKFNAMQILVIVVKNYNNHHHIGPLAHTTGHRPRLLNASSIDHVQVSPTVFQLPRKYRPTI